MKLWKYGLLIVGVSALILSNSVVAADTEIINDPENDVYYAEGLPPSATYRENVGDQPNVDIKKVSCVIEDGTLTLKLEVASDGTIQNEIDMDYSYNVVLKTSDDGMYTIMVNYAGSAGMGIGPSTPAESAGGELEISGNTLEMVWVFEGDATVEELYGDASYSPTENSVYRDIAPNTEDDTDPGNDDTDGDDTGDGGDDDSGDNNTKKPGIPGFEAVAVLAAIGVAFILIERRRK
jgi:hypothetical protein